MKNPSEELAETVPEALKNVLIVMAAKHILTPQWVVSLNFLLVIFSGHKF